MAGKNVEWDDRYLVGVQVIDEQHRELIRITNNLCQTCLKPGEEAEDDFKDAIYKTVDYILYHLTTEEQFLDKIQYPDLSNHRKQHAEFSRELLSKVSNFEHDKHLSSTFFPQYLRDWILTHISFVDKKYATYIQILKNQSASGDFLTEFKPGIQYFEKYRKLTPPQRPVVPAEIPSEYHSPPEMFWG